MKTRISNVSTILDHQRDGLKQVNGEERRDWGAAVAAVAAEKRPPPGVEDGSILQWAVEDDQAALPKAGLATALAGLLKRHPG